MQIESNDGRPIRSVAEWAAFAPPAAKHHWRPYRSACELAHDWIDGDAATRLQALLETGLGRVVLTRAIAERKTYFDDIRSGPRNHDLLVVGSELVVGIEAKADETFGEPLSKWTAQSGMKRLDGLTRTFFGTTLAQNPALGALRYQLLSALAGTLADARTFGAKHAALIVHEFETPLTAPAKQQLNADDLEAFLRRFGDAPRTFTPDGAWLAGPFSVPGSMPFYIGKLRTKIVLREPPEPAPPARRRNTARRPVSIPVGDGTTVIKLNVHPPGCRCGCGSKGDRSFVLNRPGERVRMVQGNDLDEILRRARDWAREALPGGGAHGRSSRIEVGGGMTTITLTVTPGAASIVRLPETGEEHAAGTLEAALETFRRIAGVAMRQ